MNFRKSIILSSLVATAVLFSACGGDDNKTPAVQSPTGTKPAFVSPNTYNVVAGQRKAVTLTVGENIINTEGSKFKFELVDKTEAPSTIIYESTGVIEYTAPVDGAAKSIIVKATRILEGDAVSDNFVITFNSILPSDVAIVKPYKTGADEDATTGNIDRNFIRNESIGYNIQDPSGLQWANTAGGKAKLAQLTYRDAEDYCENELDGAWRVPNKDELLNLIDYSKPGRAPMFNDLVNVPDNLLVDTWVSLTNTWATPELDKKNIFVGENNGMIIFSNNNVLSVRCVLGNEVDRKHLIHSDLLGYTYDENTKLEWSPASNDTMTATEGTTYCSNLASTHDNPHTGFRLPSINEFRSIVENGTVSDFITKGNRQLISSTPYVDENGTKLADNTWRLVLREDGAVAIGAGGGNKPDGTPGDGDPGRISCVKDMD
jgi:hypothetical protein